MENNGDIIVSIEFGDGYEPPARVAAAIGELIDAIADEHGGEVEGFGVRRTPLSTGGAGSITIGWSPSTGVLVGDEVNCELRAQHPGGGMLPTGETVQF